MRRTPSAALPDVDWSYLASASQGRKIDLNFPAQAPVAGCYFGPLSSAPDAAKKFLYSAARQALPAPLEPLHRKHGGEGICLMASPGACLELPLRCEVLAAGSAEGSFYYPHHLIVLGKGARLTLVQELRGVDDFPVFSQGVTEIFLEEGAELDYVIFQDLGSKTQSFSFESARLAVNAKFHLFHVELGSARRRLDIACDSLGAGSASRLDGVFFGRGRQSLEVSVRQDHQVGHTESDMLWKMAMGDESRAAFVGLATIYPKADKSAAFQAVHNLLLSPKAKAAPDPRLEILADDVMAKHAATIGYLDEESRFYLQSRGIPAATAQRLLTGAFLSEVLARLRPEIRREAQVRVDDLLEVRHE